MANNTNRILISLIIGLSVAGLSFKMYSDMQKEMKAKDQLIAVMKLRDAELEKKKITYITATRDMKIGETVTENDLRKKNFTNEKEGGLTSFDMAVGNVLISDIKTGEILTEKSFTGVNTKKNETGLREGHRAITLSTSSLDGLSPEMKEGAIIDIFSKSKSSPIVFSKIKILSLEPAKAQSTAEAVKDAVSKDKEQPISIKDAKTATFELPIIRVQDFVEMYASGKILLAMRPIGDDTVVTTKKKETAQAKAKASNYNQNLNYDSPAIPKLPTVQTYETPTINELPSPIKSIANTSKTIELIEASNKTQVSFD